MTSRGGSSVENQSRPRIVVGFDGSIDSQAALRYASRETVNRQGLLHIVFAVDDTALNSAWGLVFDVDAVQRSGEELLKQARALALHDGLSEDSIHTETIMGTPGEVLGRLSTDAAIVYVGRRDSEAETNFIGSTALTLIETSACPVIVVSAFQSTVQRNSIMVAVDSQSDNWTTVLWALRWAARINASVDVVSVVPLRRGWFASRLQPQQRQQTLDLARERVEALVHRAQQEADVNVEIEIQVSFGDPVHELLTIAAGSRLLILGVNPTFPAYRVTGTIRALLAHSCCPVGLVRV